MGTHLFWGGPKQGEWIEVEGLPVTVCILDRLFGREFDYTRKKLLVFRNRGYEECFIFWVYVWGALPLPTEVCDCIRQANAWQHGRRILDQRHALVPIVCLRCGWRGSTEQLVLVQDEPNDALLSPGLLAAACPRCESFAWERVE
jgi:hypothetical protein